MNRSKPHYEPRYQPVPSKDWDEAARQGTAPLPAIDAAWAAADARRGPSPFKTLAQFCAEYEPLAYAIEPIVRSRSIYTLTARTGHGKTGLMVAAAFAVARDRPDILGRPVEPGRVAYIAAENPDDVRMRLMMTAYRHGLGLEDAANRILILDKHMPPEEIRDVLERDAAERGPFRLVLADTLSALYDGPDLNDNVPVGRFVRRLRTWSTVPGSPSVMIAAHPVKNAGRDNLLPSGAGSTVNEVDGNHTMWKEGDISELHWQGKFRGPDFKPIPFRFERMESPHVLDIKGRSVPIPVCVPAEPGALEAREAERAEKNVGLLRALAEQPGASQRELAALIGVRSVSTISGRLATLAAKRFVEQGADDKYRLTARGQREVELENEAKAVRSS